MKQTTIRTKDNKRMILSHDQLFTDAELDLMREMTSREIYHVGKVREMRLEDQ